MSSSSPALSSSNFASNLGVKTPIFDDWTSFQRKQLKKDDLVKRIISVVSLDQQHAIKELKSFSEHDYKILKALCTEDDKLKSDDKNLFKAFFSRLDILRDKVAREMLEEEENLKRRHVLLSDLSAELSATEKILDAEKERLKAEQNVLKEKTQEVEDNEKRIRELKEKIRAASEKQPKLREEIAQKEIRRNELQARELQAKADLDRLKETSEQLKSGCVIT